MMTMRNLYRQGKTGYRQVSVLLFIYLTLISIMHQFFSYMYILKENLKQSDLPLCEILTHFTRFNPVGSSTPTFHSIGYNILFAIARESYVKQKQKFPFVSLLPILDEWLIDTGKNISNIFSKTHMTLFYYNIKINTIPVKL